MNRIAALLEKEFADLRYHPGLFVPPLFTAVVALVLPFVVAIVIPAVTGERLADSSDFQIAVEMFRSQPITVGMDPDGAIQAWIFQQFLPLLVIGPVAASMSVAAYAIVGEKQARSLEPLLATPITTFELLAGKVLSALLPSLALTVACFVVYAAAIALFANPGVVRILLVPRSLGVFFILGPLSALAALQLAVCVSSRVNDARAAQQIGALVILPLGGALVAQLTGMLTLTTPIILGIGLLLGVANAVLMIVAVRLFDRESILTRWT
jgi:ABC-2 type transport system permease protein